jgi:hypothetical protein
MMGQALPLEEEAAGLEAEVQVLRSLAALAARPQLLSEGLPAGIRAAAVAAATVEAAAEIHLPQEVEERVTRLPGILA